MAARFKKNNEETKNKRSAVAEMGDLPPFWEGGLGPI